MLSTLELPDPLFARLKARAASERLTQGSAPSTAADARRPQRLDGSGERPAAAGKVIRVRKTIDGISATACNCFAEA